MSKMWTPSFPEPLGRFAEDGRGRDYGLFARGTVLPADAQAGYREGGLFWLDGGTAGGQLYINEGTQPSCDFNAVMTRESSMSARIVPAAAATLAVTVAAHDNRIIELDRAAGIAVTLPSLAAALGAWFRFRIKTTFTGAASIKSVAGADIMVGHALMGNDSDNTVVDWQARASNTFDTIDMFGTSNSTGGFEGQEIEIIGGTGRWYVSIRGDAAGTEATPFQDTVT